MKTFWLRFGFGFCAAVVLSGCTDSSSTVNTVDEILLSETEAVSLETEPYLQKDLSSETVDEASSNMTEPSFRGEDQPESYRSFLETNFVGQNFKVGNLLTDWGTHRSYYATYESNGLTISGTWHVPSGEGPFPVLILNHGYFPPETYTNG